MTVYFKRIALTLSLWMFLGAQIFAQVWMFDARSYFNPLRAEIRAPQISILFPAYSSSFEFDADNQDFVAWDISLGADIPVVGFETESTARASFTRGAWGVGLWIPISWHMIENLEDKENSKPIINTDYRFGGTLKAYWQMRDSTGLQGRTGFYHESTHLGDEFTILALQSHQLFRRINVSYEAIQYGISIVHSNYLSIMGQTELILRHSGILPINDGYYSADLREIGSNTVTPPRKKYQWGLGIEFSAEKAWRPWISLEMRNRIVYDYDRPTPETNEVNHLSFNLLLGIRTELFDYNSIAPVEIYFRYYRGVNPAGQFRNDRTYQIFGLGIMSRIGR